MQICLHVHPPQLGVCSQAGLVALASLLSSDDLNKPELQLLQVVDMISITMVRLINIITQLLAALSILVQPLLQTAFLLDASCRTTGTSAQARAKPGRQAVTFLLVTAVVILLNTIISHNQRCSITIVTIKITGGRPTLFLAVWVTTKLNITTTIITITNIMIIRWRMWKTAPQSGSQSLR